MNGWMNGREGGRMERRQKDGGRKEGRKGRRMRGRGRRRDEWMEEK